MNSRPALSRMFCFDMNNVQVLFMTCSVNKYKRKMCYWWGCKQPFGSELNIKVLSCFLHSWSWSTTFTQLQRIWDALQDNGLKDKPSKCSSAHFMLIDHIYNHVFLSHLLRIRTNFNAKLWVYVHVQGIGLGVSVHSDVKQGNINI